MTSEHAHTWSDAQEPLAVSCTACGEPLIPMGRAEPFWRNRLGELRLREECTAEPEDVTVAEELARAANGDTVPAQGWLQLPERFGPLHMTITDAGRLPALSEEHTMARPIDTIAEQGEIREDWDSASERGSTIAQYATMHPSQRVEELERLPVRDLRELHHRAAGTEAWHQQGVQDARDLSRTIGQLLRSVGDEIDPQAKTEAQSMGTLR